MKKKSFSFLLVVLMLLAACTPPAAPEATTAPEAVEAQPEGGVIKVGALYPLTGADAGWAGDPYVKSHQMAIDEINAAGGIKCLGGSTLELVNGDTQSKAETGNAEMERLITKEGVIAVFGSALSQTTVPASEVAEKYMTPYIVPNALDGTITDRGLKYVFQTVNLLQDMGAKDAAWAKAQGVTTAVIAVPNISFGKEVADTWVKGAEAEGIELLENFTYEANTNDFTDTILRVKQADPDVLFIVGNAETPQFTKQLKEQGYYPKMGIITIGSGFSTTFYLNEVTPALAEGFIFTSDFAPVSKLPVPEEFKTAFKAYTGQELGGTYNTTYASTWLLADALEKSCSTDPKKLAETLRTTKFEGGKWGFQWASASFNEKGRLNEASTVIGQWQNGEMVAVWPDNLAAAKAIWPVPSWDQRGGAAAVPEVPKPKKVAALFMGPVTDQSWNQLGYEGVVKAKADCGIDFAYTESVKQTEFEETMRNYAQQDFDTIIGHSGTFTEAGKKMAAEFPNRQFIVINAITGNGTNQSGIYADYWQMGYLAGAAACQMTKTNKVAIVTAERFPMVEPSFTSFPIGAKSCGKDVTTEVVITGSFEDVNKAYEASVALADKGVDVIWHQLDAADAGVFSAAEDKGIYAIGLYNDQSSKSPTTVIASVFVSPTTQTYLAACGQVKTGVADLVNLSNGMEIVMTNLMPAEVQDAVKVVIEDLKSGKIKP